MEIIDYKEGDEDQIIELFDIVFNIKLPKERWLWRFRYNPAGKHLVRLMWDGNQLAGHFAACPIIMKVDGKDVKTVHSHSLMTHPDYRGRGIFRDLSYSFYDRLENELKYKSIWGFPNNNSHYGFVKRMGWSNLAVLHTMGIDAKNIKPKNLEFSYKKIDRFDSSHEKFIDHKISSRAKVYIKKDVSYLNWRFVEKPLTEYLRYSFQTETGSGIVIAKIYETAEKTFDLNIIDCFLDNYEDIHDFIDFIIKNIQQPINRVTLWKNIFDPDHLDLEKTGFVPVLPQTYLSARIHPSMPDIFSDYKNWYMSMGDSDVF